MAEIVLLKLEGFLLCHVKLDVVQSTESQKKHA